MLLHAQHLGTLLAKLANYPHCHPTAFAVGNGVRHKTVQAVECLFVYLDFEGTLGLFLCALFGYFSFSKSIIFKIISTGLFNRILFCIFFQFFDQRRIKVNLKLICD